MLSSVIIVFVTNKSLDEKLKTNAYQFLHQNLKELNMEAKKWIVINESEEKLVIDFKTLLLHYDILLVVSEDNLEVIFKSICNIFCYSKKESDILKIQHNDNLLTLPPGAKLLTGDNIFPVIHQQRIFILKEDSVETQFNNVLKSHLEQYTSNYNFKKDIMVHLNGNIKNITDKLKKLVNFELQTDTSISHLVVSSCHFDNIVECEKLLKSELKENFIGSIEVLNSLKMYEAKDRHIVGSLKTIEECLSMYGPENIFLSFNGGKDCTVLLHLVNTVLKVKYPNYKEPLLCLYVKSKEGFPEQDMFISQCETYYNLNIVESTSGIKEALRIILENKPNLKVAVMGTRRTDPYSQHLNAFQMTDADWPQIMRVNPLLDWHYSDIWDYLLFYKVPYCKLYNMGYTSLGSSSNTIRNPSLAHLDENSGETLYFPAYKLVKESEERSGRNAIS